MGYRVRVSSNGLSRKFGSGSQDKPYKTKQGAEKLMSKLKRRYAKLPDAKVSIVTN